MPGQLLLEDIRHCCGEISVTIDSSSYTKQKAKRSSAHGGKMSLTIDSLLALGYKSCDQAEQITVKMSSLTIYRIDGMRFMSSNQPAWQLSVTCHGDMKFTMGKDINSMCNALIGHDYTDDEQEWLNNNGGNALFLMVVVTNPQSTTTVVDVWKKGPHGEIRTYDTFTQSKEIVKTLEQKQIPPILTALTIKLSEPTYPVTIREKNRFNFGITDSGNLLFDSRVISTATISSTRAVPEANMPTLVNEAVLLQTRLQPNICHFFNLATDEMDPLRKFLFMYWVLELQTNLTFSQLTNTAHQNYPARLQTATQKIHKNKGWEKQIRQQFIWCAIERWIGIDDVDFSTFESVKDVRDNISHGKQIDHTTLPIEKLEMLVRKALSYA